MNVILNDDVFGRNLHLLRTRRGLSLQQLAAHLGMEPSALCAIENGTQREISVDFMIAVGSCFHTSLADLLSGPLL